MSVIDSLSPGALVASGIWFEGRDGSRRRALEAIRAGFEGARRYGCILLKGRRRIGKSSLLQYSWDHAISCSTVDPRECVRLLIDVPRDGAVLHMRGWQGLARREDLDVHGLSVLEHLAPGRVERHVFHLVPGCRRIVLQVDEPANLRDDSTFFHLMDLLYVFATGRGQTLRQLVIADHMALVRRLEEGAGGSDVLGLTSQADFPVLPLTEEEACRALAARTNLREDALGFSGLAWWFTGGMPFHVAMVALAQADGVGRGPLIEGGELDAAIGAVARSRGWLGESESFPSQLRAEVFQRQPRAREELILLASEGLLGTRALLNTLRVRNDLSYLAQMRGGRGLVLMRRVAEQLGGLSLNSIERDPAWMETAETLIEFGFLSSAGGALQVVDRATELWAMGGFDGAPGSELKEPAAGRSSSRTERSASSLPVLRGVVWQAGAGLWTWRWSEQEASVRVRIDDPLLRLLAEVFTGRVRTKREVYPILRTALTLAGIELPEEFADAKNALRNILIDAHLVSMPEGRWEGVFRSGKVDQLGRGERLFAYGRYGVMMPEGGALEVEGATRLSIPIEPGGQPTERDLQRWLDAWADWLAAPARNDLRADGRVVIKWLRGGDFVHLGRPTRGGGDPMRWSPGVAVAPGSDSDALVARAVFNEIQDGRSVLQRVGEGEI